MKKRLSILLSLALCASVMTASAVTRGEDRGAPATAESQAPGAQLAESISTITGVAISPLLGASAYGAYKWWKAGTPQARAKLPWFAQPWFWGPALLVVALCFLKDSAGTALPTAVKKPLDVVDTVEHKISGLVATGAFVPFIVMMMDDSSSQTAMLSSMGFATIDSSWFGHLLLVPVMMIAFFIVFLASNAINILILLSPFTTVDAALKLFRTAVLGTVVASAWVNPWVGAAWALIIIGLAWLIAGWSFRLSFFGMVYVWEFCTVRSNRFKPDATANKIFLWRKINKVPARTYGKLTRDEQGQLVLTYRPWLVFKQRTLVLPEGKYAVGKALCWQSLQLVNGDESQNMVLLPPRYWGHEEEMVKIYNLTDVREAGLRRAWKWTKELFTGKPQAIPAPA
jgi:hypothetical protein